MTGQNNYDAKLDLNGSVYNFLVGDLVIVDASGRELTKIPCTEKVHIEWIPKEKCPQYQTSHGIPDEARLCDESWRVDLVTVEDCHPSIDADLTVIGQLNSFFDLVAPARPPTDLLSFWRAAKALQRAHVVGLPSLKDLRKRQQYGQKPHCIVSRGVAMLAYLSHQEMDTVLLPALPVMLADQQIGYRALMPMSLVLKSLANAGR